jgi:HEAT repeat protein
MLTFFFLAAAATNAHLALLLRGYDNALSPQAMAQISTDPVGDLIAVADDEAQPLFVRARAVSLFGRFIESRSLAALLRLARHEAPELRVKALKGLKLYAQKKPDASVTAALSAGLADTDRFVRMQAVRGLAAMPSARAQLEQRLGTETDEGVRLTLREVLGL